MAAKVKIPPNNIDAEKSVLGAILIDEDAVYKVAEMLVPENFYDKSHREIFEAVINLYNNRSAIDVLTLTSELNKRKKLKAIGGSDYLSDLVAGVPTSAHVEEYAKIIKEAYVRRRLISLGGRIDEMAYQEEEDLDVVLDTAEQSLLKIAETSSDSDFVHVGQLLEEAYERAEDLNKDPNAMRGIGTGFPYLDGLLGGLQRSDMIILAARPSVGKTAFALDVARHAAVKGKQSVAIFSLEMSNTQLMDRLLSMQVGVGLWNLRMGKIKDEEFARLSDAMGVLSESNLYIDDTPGVGIMEIRTKARKLKIEKGLDLIVIDYLQLITGRKAESRQQEVAEISRLIKGIARELDVPVLSLSQLSRAVEQRGEATPQLSDLRDSGSIEQDADVVIFLNKMLGDEDDKHTQQNRMLTVAKHRNGPTGQVELHFVADQARFREVDRAHSGGSF